MNFASDNWSGVAPQVEAALARHGSGFQRAYGGSDVDEAARVRISKVFEHDCSVLFVPTGTAANSLAAALCGKPGGIVLAHSHSHMIEDECGSPHFAMGGGRIQPVGGANGKIAPEAMAKALKRHDPPYLHHGRPVMLSLTQASEAGTVYSVAEISELAGQAKQASLLVHMDGSRFANAVTHLGCGAADMTWRAGVDLVSLGGTKNGCWCAEALVLFDRRLQEEAEYLRKRSGWLFSKSRFVAAQFLGWFEDGAWLDMAAHANAMSADLQKGINASKNAKLAWPTQANEVFVLLDRALAARLGEQGAIFGPWDVPSDFQMPADYNIGLYRLVTSFATAPEEVQMFCDLIDRG